jgi:hypothetical protein
MDVADPFPENVWWCDYYGVSIDRSDESVMVIVEIDARECSFKLSNAAFEFSDKPSDLLRIE